MDKKNNMTWLITLAFMMILNLILLGFKPDYNGSAEHSAVIVVNLAISARLLVGSIVSKW